MRAMCVANARTNAVDPHAYAPACLAVQRRDAELALALDRALASLPRFDSRFIGVVVWEGAVTVSGVVESQEAHERARAAIAEMPGVVAVRDTLLVKTITRD
jgi:osmotically-inducible protein OsmY